MARPKSYDRADVLQQALMVFWFKGYRNTSMMDIQKATGLKPGSLYEGFGDKHSLFLAVLAHYRKTVVAQRLERLKRPGRAKERLMEFFDDLITFSLGEGKKLGCLMSNSAIECAQSDAEVREIVQDNLVEIAEAFCDVIEQGQHSAEFTTREKPEDLARFLTSTVQGLRVMAKSATTEETLKTTARVALSVLD